MFNTKGIFRHSLFVVFSYIIILLPILPSEFKPDQIEQTQKVHSLRFKLGYEFQEISSLCPWAWPNNKIQKQALFEFVGPDNKRHWHVELDTVDIEFVTVPFPPEAEHSLKLALLSIEFSIKQLEQQLNSKQGNIIFKDWFESLNGFQSYDNCKLVVLQDWILAKTLTCTKLPWKPSFAPQATIQHPLEWTIPLYFGLFGFESSYMLSFYGSLPYRELLRKAAKELNRIDSGQILQSYTKKLNGLVFLHAYTLIGMTPAGADDDDDAEALTNTAKNITTTFQVDPKVNLCLMSRRPFSSMVRDIKPVMTQPYQAYFQESIINGNYAFTKFFEVPALFYATNYGEQFFNLEGSITPLNGFPTVIDIEEVFFQQNKDAITSLLKEGVITTTMIRHIKNGVEIMKGYYQHAVDIEKPQHKRYNININYQAKQLSVAQKEDDSHDSISPPWFLEQNNSMGRYNKEEEIDKSFGEAIIEVRGIKNIGVWCLERLKLDKNSDSGKVLTDPSLFTVHGIKLFQFLIGFSSELASDVQMGILINAEQFKMGL
jgi:hypothetical protein